MAQIGQLSIKSRLMLLVLGASLGALLILGGLSWLRFRNAFQTQVFEHLISVRAAKGKQLETYLGDIQSHVATLSEDQMVVAAMVELGSTYRDLQSEAIADEQLTAIEKYYTDEFLPALAENVESVQILANYRPTTQAAQYLQYQYIVSNTAADEADLDAAADESAYSTVHGRYHPLFRNLIQQFGYEDLYLIDFNTGDVVYSVQKKSEYATSLDRGPYRRSNLSTVIEAVRNDPGRGFVQVADYQPYVPAYSAPAGFFAAPIYNGPHIVGILAIQLPTENINSLLTGDQEWQQDGLGETGQVYLVGDDFLMRSMARPLIEDAAAYQETLERIGLSPQTVNLVERLNTSILLHPVETAAVDAALTGDISTQIVEDYRGVSVLSSYAPLRLNGLRWLILAEMDQAEAFSPVTQLQVYMGILGVILILLIAWLSNFAAQSFVSPIQKLLDITDRIRAGERDLEIEIGDDSRLDRLEEALQGLLQDLHTQEALVAEKTAANKALLHNMMPTMMAARMMAQETRPIAESAQQVTILVARISSFGSLAQTQSSEAIAAICDRLVRSFDDRARYYGLDTQLTLDETYIATCGLSQTFLDHQERTLNFALDLIRLLEAGSLDFPAGLEVYIAIHSGPVTMGVVGEAKFMYKLLGGTITTVLRLNPLGETANSILVTQPIHDRLRERYWMVPLPAVTVAGVGSVARWRIFTQTAAFTQQMERVQTSFALLLPQLSALAERFYGHLMQTSPLVHTRLMQSLEDPQAQFIDGLKGIVSGLGTLEELLTKVQQWGKQQAHPWSDDNDKEVEVSFLWALASTLAADLTPEVEQAWRTLYHLLSGVFQEATAHPYLKKLEAV